MERRTKGVALNYYFFPEIEGFESSVTLVNFPCLEKFPLRQDVQKIYVTWSDGSRWYYEKIDTIAPNETKEIKRSDLPKNIQGSPFVFFHYLDLPKDSEELILSDHMHFMPTWRGNIKIFSSSAATSYEGDYQYEMIKYIKKGSLVSISPMIQQGENVSTKFLLVNMTSSAAKHEHDIYFFDPLREKILHHAKLFNNTCNVVSLDDVHIPQDTPLLCISKTIAGIPIYFSHTKNGRFLSFEHTHPPASLVVFGDPLYFQRKLKNHWLSKLESLVA